MRSIFIIISIFSACAAIGQNQVFRIVNESYVDAANFGFSPDSVDCANKFKEIFDSAQVRGTGIYINTPGTYNFVTEVLYDSVYSDVNIIACPGVTFKSKLVQPFRFWVKGEDIKSSLTYPVTRGDKTVTGAAFAAGESILITQTRNVPGVGVGADILRHDGTEFVEPFLFTTTNIDSANSVLRLPNISFYMSGISFVLDTVYEPPAQLLSLQKFCIAELDNCDFRAKSGQTVDGASIYGCSKVLISGLDATNMRYPVLLNLCNDVDVRNGTVKNSRHYTATSTWCRDVFVTDIIADSLTRTPIEAHYGWNIWYNNITSTQTDQINLRCFGDLRLTNCNITSDNSFNGGDPGTDYSLLGYHFATGNLYGTEYEWLIKGTKMYFYNVNYDETVDGKFRGLSATAFDQCIIKRCTTKCVGGYENSQSPARLYVEDSEFGHIYWRNGGDHAQIKDCTIDGNRSTQNWIQSCSLQDTISFYDCTFNNCSTKELEENWQASGNPATYGWSLYENITATFENLAVTSSTGALYKHPFIFKSSNITFDDNYQSTYSGQSTPTIIEVKHSNLNWNDFSIP